jgi:signal transduction histidine kinase
MYLVDTGMSKGNEERVEKGWETVQRNVMRIRNMVSDILYYAKDRTPNWEKLSSRDIAEEVFASMENRARDQQVELVTEFDPDAGEFQADGQAVRALLMNLLENALDACRLDEKKSEHRVTFRLRGLRDHIEFEVEDNGIGMDQETREKAFTLFFSSKGTGTGLGLFIADKIATAHGGTIELNSEPDSGCHFVVQLPREAPAVEESTSDPDTDTTLSTEKDMTHG